MNLINKTVTVSALIVSIAPLSAFALDSYPASLQDDFSGWCTGQGYTASVCNCAVTKAAVEIPAVTMASFLAADKASVTATVSAGVGATALQIITTCAVANSGTDSNTLNSLGSSLFGK